LLNPRKLPLHEEDLNKSVWNLLCLLIPHEVKEEEEDRHPDAGRLIHLHSNSQETSRRNDHQCRNPRKQNALRDRHERSRSDYQLQTIALMNVSSMREITRPRRPLCHLHNLTSSSWMKHYNSSTSRWIASDNLMTL
jgi:hypothetical protein